VTGEQEQDGPQDTAAELQAEQALNRLSGGAGTFLIPQHYRVDHTGVQRETIGRDGTPGWSQITYAPLAPVRVHESFEGEQWLELAWTDGERTVHETVPRSVAKSGRKLVAALGDRNIPVIESDAREVERWLAAAEAANRAAIEHVQIARQLGWQPDGQFVAASGKPYRVEPKFREQVPALDAHHARGTLEGWQRVVKPVQPYPAALLPLYAGFAAALLVPLNLDSGTLDVSGRSSRGKSTAAKLGLSPWACPSEKGGALATWKTTLLALEKRLHLVNGVPVVIDETQTVKYDGIVNDVLYLVPFNHGTQRGAGYPSALPWRTVVISTGERSALTYTVEEGASGRVLCITEPPFGTANGELVNEIREGLDENYGTAGPAFVEKLRERLTEADGSEWLRARHARAVGLHAVGSDLNKRRAPLVGAIHLAGQLAYEFGIVPFEPPKLEVWQRILGTSDHADNRPEMALDVVKEYVAAHGDELWAPSGGFTGTQPYTGWLGRRESVSGGVRIGIMPERLRRILADARYELDAVIPGWLEAGVLSLQPSQRPAHLVKRRIAGTQTRVYEFEPHVFPDGTGDEG
jgi:hypothetical protein